MSSRYAFIYIDKRSRDANLLVYSRLSLKSLEKALCSNTPEHSTLFEVAKLGQKHITSLLSTEREKKIHEINQANRGIILCNKRFAIHGDAIINS